MPLPLSTARAAKTMPAGKGTYGSKKGRPAKKKENPFAKKAAAKKAAAKKAPAKGASKGKSKMPPAMLKRMEMMKKKKSAKK